jgi:hypothetical protein
MLTRSLSDNWQKYLEFFAEPCFLRCELPPQEWTTSGNRTFAKQKYFSVFSECHVSDVTVFVRRNGQPAEIKLLR